jgi:hypothetical protein
LRIAGEFPGDSREIATDILAFLNELASEGLLVGVQDGLLSQRE